MSTKAQRRQLKFDQNRIETLRDSGISVVKTFKDATVD